MEILFNLARLPDYEKGTLKKNTYQTISYLLKRDCTKLKTHSEMVFVQYFEYLNVTRFYLGYPSISLIIFLLISWLFSVEQAGCTLVALAIFTEGVFWVVKNRLDLMVAFKDNPALTNHANQSMKKHIRKMSAMHPNLFKWALVNAFVGTLVWGFS